MRLAWLAAACAVFISLRADAPDLAALSPIGAVRGTTNVVTLLGKFNPWPPKFWSDPPGLVITADTNKSKITIVVPNDIAAGSRLIRAYNAEGVSEPCFFVVGASRELSEKEPNNRIADAQAPGVLPTTINGRLDKNDDVDDFKVTLAAGEWLDARLESYTLMSKMDGVLRLLTTNGVTLAWNHDYATFDPRLWWQAPANQTVVVQVFGFAYPANSDIRLTGGDEAFYRLHLGTNPPIAWKNSPTNMGPITAEVSGTIERVGQEDRWIFSAKKDQHYEARVFAATIGSPLDPWLKIRDRAGADLQTTDDSDGSRDPRVEWKAPATTNYFLTIGSTLHRAGPNHHYRASIKPIEPDFRATWSAHSLVLKPGETNALKIDLKRLRGFTNDLAATLSNLPDGVSCLLTNSLAKAGEISFAIIAATNAHAFQGPLQLHLIDALRKVDRTVEFDLTTTGENNGVPNGYTTLAINSLKDFWLTVKAGTNSPAK